MEVFFDIIGRHSEAFLKGMHVTLRLALNIWGFGLVFGSLIGILSAKYRFVFGLPTRILTFVLSGIPVLVFLYWAHYPMQTILGVVIDPFFTAAFVLSTVNVFSVAEIIRSSLIDFPEQYNIAAKVCGLSSKTNVLRIQLPIILRQVIPPLLTLQVIMLHTTLFASLISVEEIFRVSMRINSIEYKPIHIYSALALLFLIISLPVNGLAIWLRHRFTRNLSEN
jgi:ABC-type amino acid transport system permease subunit